MTTTARDLELSENRTELLELLNIHRFATSNQLTRFTRPRYASAASARRQTLRHLAGLEHAGLVTSLERRVGGWRGGSQVSVWSLTTTGYRLLTGTRRRQRPHAISTTFLAHTLAITDVSLIFTEVARARDDTRLELVQEPACWRRFTGAAGEVVTIRPDLAATVMTPEYTDRYVLEVDQATENPARVVRTTRRYLDYRATGREQAATGVFPALVWIVPHTRRQEQLIRHLRDHDDIPPNLWLVLVRDQLPRLIRDGPAAFAAPD